MRKKMIAGNWKMFKTIPESIQLAQDLAKLSGQTDSAEIVVCPPYTSLYAVCETLKNSKIGVGAQDIHWEDQGAFTGKISHDMISSTGAKYVIIGHSEQRTYFNETDESVNRKVKKALSAGLVPIVCIGETLQEREGNQTNAVVEKQTKGAFLGIPEADAIKCVLAYEPVWAIGTGKVATPEQAEEVHAFLRGLLTTVYSTNLSNSMRILYGGSMKADNAKSLLAQPNIDGGLIGGASLKADTFQGIIDATK